MRPHTALDRGYTGRDPTFQSDRRGNQTGKDRCPQGVSGTALGKVVDQRRDTSCQDEQSGGKDLHPCPTARVIVLCLGRIRREWRAYGRGKYPSHNHAYFLRSGVSAPRHRPSLLSLDHNNSKTTETLLVMASSPVGTSATAILSIIGAEAALTMVFRATP